MSDDTAIQRGWCRGVRLPSRVWVATYRRETMSQAETTETESYQVNYWATTECFMDVEATSEEEAIEEAKRLMEEEMYYGDVSDPVAKDCDNFQARKR